MPSFIDPVPGSIVTSGWGRRRVRPDGVGWHEGLDFFAPIGTPIRAIDDGRVTFIDRTADSPAGLFMMLEHPDGWLSRYMHISRFMVGDGAIVKKGNVIALVGNTADPVLQSSGPHLHFDLAALDPTQVYKWGAPKPYGWGKRKSSSGRSYTGVPAEPFIPANYNARTKLEAVTHGIPLHGGILGTSEGDPTPASPLMFAAAAGIGWLTWRVLKK